VHGRYQPVSKADYEHAAENQSLGKVEHEPVSNRDKDNSIILAETAPNAQSTEFGEL
jgi:hypothetical protein